MRSLFKVLGIASILFVLGTGTAQATLGDIAGSAVCNPQTGLYDATWTVTFSRVPDDVTGTWTVTGDAAGSGTHTGNGVAGTVTSSHAPNSSASVVLGVGFTNGHTDGGRASLSFGDSCGAPEETTTTTAPAETTTTTVPEVTTTTAPAEVTTTTAPAEPTTTVPATTPTTSGLSPDTTTPTTAAPVIDEAASTATSAPAPVAAVALCVDDEATPENECELPATGAPLAARTALGSILLLAGVALVAAARRPRFAAERAQD